MNCSLRYFYCPFGCHLKHPCGSQGWIFFFNFLTQIVCFHKQLKHYRYSSLVPTAFKQSVFIQSAHPSILHWLELMALKFSFIVYQIEWMRKKTDLKMCVNKLLDWKKYRLFSVLQKSVFYSQPFDYTYIQGGIN